MEMEMEMEMEMGMEMGMGMGTGMMASLLICFVPYQSTLLKRILKEFGEAGKRVAVVQNEFSGIAITITITISFVTFVITITISLNFSNTIPGLPYQMPESKMPRCVMMKAMYLITLLNWRMDVFAVQ